MPGKKVDMTLPDDASPEYIAQWSVLKRCSGCDRPMRPAFTKAADWPATVAYGAGTRCKTCYNRSYLASKKPSAAAASVQRVKVRRNGSLQVRHIELKPRAEVASGWSEEERSAALTVCGVVGDAQIAGEVLELLGLFDIDRMAYAEAGLGNFRNPRT